MKILVCGCGKIGSTMCADLVAEGHDVVALDKDPAIISQITNTLDVMGVCGNAADCETLKDAGIAETELFIAVTGSDEVNMLSCFLARKMGADHTIARIRNPEYNDKSLDFLRHELHLSQAINPDLLAAKELFDILQIPSAIKVESFTGNTFKIIELIIKENSPLDGLVLRDFKNKYNTRVLICAVQRGQDVYIPDGNFMLKEGDRIGLTASPNELVQFLRKIDLMHKKARDVIILGGSRTAYYLAKMLEASGGGVKIIEKDPAVAEALSDSLNGTTVVCGDGTQQELLLEEGLASTDAFVTLTGTDEENILISIYAASKKVPKVISKVNSNELAAMAEKLGLESIVSPKKIISNILARYARALENSKGSQVETLYKLMDNHVEALEFLVDADSKIISTPIKDLSLKPNTIIAGIIRGRTTIAPGGNDVILPNDRVVIIAENQRLRDLSDILK